MQGYVWVIHHYDIDVHDQLQQLRPKSIPEIAAAHMVIRGCWLCRIHAAAVLQMMNLLVHAGLIEDGVLEGITMLACYISGTILMLQVVRLVNFTGIDAAPCQLAGISLESPGDLTSALWTQTSNGPQRYNHQTHPRIAHMKNEDCPFTGWLKR